MRLTFLFIHLQGSCPINTFMITNNKTNSPYSHSHVASSSNHCRTVELHGVFSLKRTPEICTHSQWYYWKRVIQIEKKNEVENVQKNVQGKYFYLCTSSTKATRKKSLTQFVWKHCLSANDLLWVVEKKADWPLSLFFFFFRNRGDMMIVEPLLALESPLLLLLPPVLVAHVRLHSGFQCCLLSVCS